MKLEYIKTKEAIKLEEDSADSQNPLDFTLNYAHKEDAGIDLKTTENCVILPRLSALVPTGVKLNIPPGYYGKIEAKSGLSVKFNLETGAGVIDHGYHGELMAHVYNKHNRTLEIFAGDKICQIILLKLPEVTLSGVKEFSFSYPRGDGGFGSTDKKTQTPLPSLTSLAQALTSFIADQPEFLLLNETQKELLKNINEYLWKATEND